MCQPVYPDLLSMCMSQCWCLSYVFILWSIVDQRKNQSDLFWLSPSLFPHFNTRLACNPYRCGKTHPNQPIAIITPPVRMRRRMRKMMKMRMVDDEKQRGAGDYRCLLIKCNVAALPLPYLSGAPPASGLQQRSVMSCSATHWMPWSTVPTEA